MYNNNDRPSTGATGMLLYERVDWMTGTGGVVVSSTGAPKSHYDTHLGHCHSSPKITSSPRKSKRQRVRTHDDSRRSERKGVSTTIAYHSGTYDSRVVVVVVVVVLVEAVEVGVR